jgi:flagellar protein FlaF
MYSTATQAYGKTSQQTVSPRDLEANLLIKAASRLQTVKDDWDVRKGELSAALTYNRRLWTVFLDAVTRDDSPLPKDIRENIANLAVFIFKHSMQLLTNKSPEKLTILISINREVAAGLRAKQYEAEKSE